MTEQGLLDILAGIGLAQAKTEAVMVELGLGHAQARLETEELKKVVAETSRRVEETAKVVAETSRRVDETSRKLDEVGLRLGSMSQNLGDMAETFFYNSLVAAPEIGGISFDRVAHNMIVGSKSRRSEFDIVLTNGATIAIVEVKLKAHVKDLNQIDSQIKRYRELFPEHKDYAIYGGIASLTMPRDVLAEARAQGYFVLEQIGNVMSSATEGMRAH